ncbi:unnamed protein product [Prunus brigantina]
MEIVDIATKLNRLKVHIDMTYLVHSALDSLSYDQMKSSYNTLKEDWTIDDLITIVILENRTQACGGVVNMVTTKKMFSVNMLCYAESSSEVFGGVEETKNAKQFMESIERKVKEYNMTETKNIMSRLANTKYERGSVREHLMELVDIATKLNMVKVLIDPTNLVDSALDSIPYDHMKSTYNTLKEDWTMDELITIFILENRTQAYGVVVNMVTTKKYENKGVAKWEVKNTRPTSSSQFSLRHAHENKVDISARVEHRRFLFFFIPALDCAKFIKHEKNAIGNEDFNFEEEGNVAVIENDEQEVTTLIPLSETVLEPPQFEEPVDK